MGISTLGDWWPQELKPPAPAPKAEPATTERNPIDLDPGDLCPKTGKVPYGKKRDAMTHMASLARANPDCILNVYVCRWCYSWHVGRL